MTKHRRAGATPSLCTDARRLSVCWAAGAVLAIGGGASALAATGAAAAAPGGCPVLAPSPAGTTLGQGPVLSGSVAVMRLCRYGALPARRLAAQHLTRSHALISGLHQQLNALLPVPLGPTNCPEDNGSEILLLARYRTGQTAKVTIELSGCRTVRRGRVAKSAEISPGGPALLAHLERLTA